MVISLMVATDKALGIVKENQLLCHLPKDLNYFKQQTLGKPVLMGNTTFKSIGKALPGRPNLVLSRQVQPARPGVAFFSTLQTALDSVRECPEVMVIGGAELYRQAMPLATKIYQTEIHHQFEADRFFPEISAQQWTLISESYCQKDEKNAYDMTFKVYQRETVQS